MCISNISDCFRHCENCTVKPEWPRSAPTQTAAKQLNRKGLKKLSTYPEKLEEVYNTRHNGELSPLQEVEGESTPTKPITDSQDDHTNKTDDRTPAHDQNNSLQAPPPQKSQLEPEVAIHVLAPALFENEYPYKLFLGNYI